MKNFNIKGVDENNNEKEVNIPLSDILSCLKDMNIEYIEKNIKYERIKNKLYEFIDLLTFINVEEFVKDYNFEDYESCFKLEDDLQLLYQYEQKIKTYKYFNIILDYKFFDLYNLTAEQLEDKIVDIINDKDCFINDMNDVCVVLDENDLETNDMCVVLNFFIHNDKYDEYSKIINECLFYCNLYKYVLKTNYKLNPMSFKNFR